MLAVVEVYGSEVSELKSSSFAADISVYDLGFRVTPNAKLSDFNPETSKRHKPCSLKPGPQRMRAWLVTSS